MQRAVGGAHGRSDRRRGARRRRWAAGGSPRPNRPVPWHSRRRRDRPRAMTGSNVGDGPDDLGVHRSRGFELVGREDALRNVGRPRHERAAVRLRLGGHPRTQLLRHARSRWAGHRRKLSCADAAQRRSRAVGRTGFELGSVGRRRPARNAESDHARRGSPRGCRGPNRARCSRSRCRSTRPVRSGTTCTCRSGPIPNCVRIPSTSLSRATPVTSPRATTRSAWARKPSPTGMRSRTWATTGSSTTTSRTTSCTTEGGAAKLGIENFGPVVTRGVLLDIARGHGVDHFDDNYAITGADLDAAATAAGISIAAGDAILIRTGQMHFLRAGDKQRYSLPVARTVNTVDRVVARQRHRRGRHRHDDLRGLSVRRPGRVHAGAHDPTPRHGPGPGPELAPRRSRRATAPPTAGTTSCSSRRRCR